jgi:hypothetical protein
MRLDFLVEKIYYRFYKYVIAGKNHRCFYKGTEPKPQKIIFYLHDKKFVHLGDSLWFEPLIRFLSGYFPVSVYSITAMEFYFESLGHKIAGVTDMDESSLIIAPIELMYKLKHVKNALYLNFDYKLLVNNQKMIDSMIVAIAGFFNLPYDLIDGKYHALEYLDNELRQNLLNFNMVPDLKYVLFNDYIDSWGKYTTLAMLNNHRKILADYAKEFKSKNPEIKLVYVGSKADLTKDNNLLWQFIDIDLRGKTTIENLFMMAAVPQIIAYIGFDTFLLHLFNMYDKPSHILLKPGNLEKINQLLINGVLVPYVDKNNKSKVSLIDRQ